jgi:hypothetical protein
VKLFRAEEAGEISFEVWKGLRKCGQYVILYYILLITHYSLTFEEIYGKYKSRFCNIGFVAQNLKTLLP